MRGLKRIGALVLAAAAVARIGFVDAEVSLPTAVIPLDLGDHELGRELTILFNVDEAESLCGPSSVQLNNQPLAIGEDGSGRGTFLEDYGSEVSANWRLECVEVDGEPLKKTISFQIETVDGDVVEDVAFEVHFRQVAPVAILGFDGAALDATIIDGDEEDEPNYWELFGDESVDEDEDEVELAMSEVQYLRMQRHEIDHRIAELLDFIRESDESVGICHTVRCYFKTVFDKVTGAASKAYEHVIGPDRVFDGPHGKPKFPWPFPHHGKHHHGNHTHGNHTHPPHPHPPHKRPHWLPPFCRPPPHHPKKPHHPEEPPQDPPEKLPHQPHHPHQRPPPPPEEPPRDPPSDEQPPVESPSDDAQVSRPPHKSERPMSAEGLGSARKHPAEMPNPHWIPQKTIPFAVEMCIVALVFLVIAGSIHRCCCGHSRAERRALRNALRQHCRQLRAERWASRREKRRQRKEKILAWFKNIFHRVTGQLSDAEKLAAQNEQRQQVQQAQEAQQRVRSESDASNTMEQDIAQFREVAGIVGSLVAAEEGRVDREVPARSTPQESIHRDAGPVPPHMAPPPLPQPSHPGFVNYPIPPPPPPPPQSYPVHEAEHDIPPAYESEEDEDTLVSSSMVTDGFMYMPGANTYTPSPSGSSHTGSDELGYSNKL